MQGRTNTRNRNMLRSSVLALILPIFLCACQNTFPRVRVDARPEPLMHPNFEIPEQLLFDVRVQIFDAGELPTSKNASLGLSKKIRNAEATYMAVQLRNTLQESENWGAVRVVSAPHAGDELLVVGRIRKSNGEEMRLGVSVFDATGREWFSQSFRCAVTEEQHDEAETRNAEVFQNIYNRISNRLATYCGDLTVDDIQEIRCVAKMRFAEELVPSAFNGYLREEKVRSSAWPLTKLDRLPSEDDEFMVRVERVRGKDYMLVDTLDAHYDGLHAEMRPAYVDWRKSRITEMNIIREVDRRHNEQVAKAVALIIAGAVIGGVAGANNVNLGAAVGAAVGAGVALMVRANSVKAEAEINMAALEELGMSFGIEMEPMTLQLEGKTVTLTGNAEAQYEQWGSILAELYKIEIDAVLPEDHRPGY